MEQSAVFQQRLINMLRIVWFILFVILSAASSHELLLAQDDTNCGVVDAIGFPISDSVEIDEGYDDFGLYRQRFGGLHTAIDIGFERQGDPIYAVARGRVTYSNPEGWDTEKGVVIIEHRFNDGSIAYSLYGHVEQTDQIILPPVGTCVQYGDIIAAIGWPSRGSPHLHYELRNFLPDDGGPGYVEVNPLELGWYHPIDFTRLWQAKLSPGFVNYVAFDAAPSQPPVLLENGIWVFSSNNELVAVGPPNMVLWRSQFDSTVTGLLPLSGNRIAVHLLNGQVLTLDSTGSFLALWQQPGPDIPFVTYQDTLAFVTEEGGVQAYDLNGELHWSAPPIEGNVIQFETNGMGQLIQIVRQQTTIRWRILDILNGNALYEADGRGYLLATAGTDGTWTLLEDTTEGVVIWHWGDGQPDAFFEPDIFAPQRGTRLVVDTNNTLYGLFNESSLRLVSLTDRGEQRWQHVYEEVETGPMPLLATDGRLVYTLSTNGIVQAFRAQDGVLICQLQIYSGGVSGGEPRGRLLYVQNNGTLLVGAGFLTTILLNPDEWCPN